MPFLEPPTEKIIWVLFKSFRISVKFVRVYLMLSIGLAFVGERVKSLGVPGFCFARLDYVLLYPAKGDVLCSGAVRGVSFVRNT